MSAQVPASEIAAALKEIRGPLEIHIQEHPNSPLKAAWAGVEKMQAILDGDYRALWLAAQKEIRRQAEEIEFLQTTVSGYENGCIRPRRSTAASHDAVVRALLAAGAEPARPRADSSALLAALRAMTQKPIPQSPPEPVAAAPPEEGTGDEDLYS